MSESKGLPRSWEEFRHAFAEALRAADAPQAMVAAVTDETHDGNALYYVHGAWSDINREVWLGDQDPQAAWDEVIDDYITDAVEGTLEDLMNPHNYGRRGPPKGVVGIDVMGLTSKIIAHLRATPTTDLTKASSLTAKDVAQRVKEEMSSNGDPSRVTGSRDDASVTVASPELKRAFRNKDDKAFRAELDNIVTHLDNGFSTGRYGMPFGDIPTQRMASWMTVDNRLEAWTESSSVNGLVIRIVDRSRG